MQRTPPLLGEQAERLCARRDAKAEVQTMVGTLQAPAQEELGGQGQLVEGETPGGACSGGPYWTDIEP